MKCPHCYGKGGYEAFVNRGLDISEHSVEWIACRTCDGTGSISQNRADLIARGKALRDARVERGESLLEASRRIGIGPADLSIIEHGRGALEDMERVEKIALRPAAQPETGV